MCCLLLWIRFDQIMDSLATQIQRIDVFFQSSFAEDFVREHIFLSENRCFSQNCFILSWFFVVVKRKKTKKDIYSQSSMAGCWSKGNMRPTEVFWLVGHLLNTSVWSHDPACAGWRAGRGAHKGYWLHLLSTCSPIGCLGSLFILIFISFFIDIVSSMPCF